MSCIVVLFKKKKKISSSMAETIPSRILLPENVCLCVCEREFGIVQMSCSQVKEGRETRVEENERSLSGGVLSCCGEPLPSLYQRYGLSQAYVPLREPSLTLKNLFGFCFVNRLLLLSWKAGDAIRSPSPTAVALTEGGIVSETPGFLCG